MRVGALRAALVVLVAALTLLAAGVPAERAGAAESGSVLLPWVPNNDEIGELGPWQGVVIVQSLGPAFCSVKIWTPSPPSLGATDNWILNRQVILDPYVSVQFTAAELEVPEPGSAVYLESEGCDISAAMKQASPDFPDAPWSNGVTVATGYTGVPDEDMLDQSTWYLPIVQTNTGWNTYIRITNAELFNADDITIEIFPARNLDGAGGRVFAATVPLGAGKTYDLDLLDTINQEGFVGFAKISSTGKIAAFAHREKPESKLAMISMGNAQQIHEVSIQVVMGPYRLYAPIIFNAYNGWNTGINIANTRDVPANVTISYPGTSRPNDTLTLAPYSSDYVFTLSTAPNQVGFAGSAIIESDQPISVVVDEVKYGTQDALSYSASAVPSDSAAIPVVFKGNQEGTRNDASGVNISNAGATAITVQVTVYNRSGGVAGQVFSVDVPANGTNFVYLPNTSLPYDTLGSALVRGPEGAQFVAISNDVSYDVQGNGSAVFAGLTQKGYYRIGP